MNVRYLNQTVKSNHRTLFANYVRRAKSTRILKFETCFESDSFITRRLKAYCAIRHTWRIVLSVAHSFQFL